MHEKNICVILSASHLDTISLQHAREMGNSGMPAAVQAQNPTLGMGIRGCPWMAFTLPFTAQLLPVVPAVAAAALGAVCLLWAL